MTAALARVFMNQVGAWIQGALGSTAISVGVPIAAGIVANEVLEQQPQVVVITHPPPIVITPQPTTPVPAPSSVTDIILILIALVILLLALTAYKMFYGRQQPPEELEMTLRRVMYPSFRRSTSRAPPTPIV